VGRALDGQEEPQACSPLHVVNWTLAHTSSSPPSARKFFYEALWSRRVIILNSAACSADNQYYLPLPSDSLFVSSSSPIIIIRHPTESGPIDLVRRVPHPTKHLGRHWLNPPSCHGIIILDQTHEDYVQPAAAPPPSPTLLAGVRLLLFSYPCLPCALRTFFVPAPPSPALLSPSVTDKNFLVITPPANVPPLFPRAAL
jgi:hypothetical protein